MNIWVSYKCTQHHILKPNPNHLQWLLIKTCYIHPVTSFASTDNVLFSMLLQLNVYTDNDPSIQAGFCGCSVLWSLLEVSKLILQRQGQAEPQAHFCLGCSALFVHHSCSRNLGPELQRREQKSTPQLIRMSPSTFLLAWREALVWRGKVSWFIAMELKVSESFGLAQGWLISLGIYFTVHFCKIPEGSFPSFVPLTPRIFPVIVAKKATETRQAACSYD